MSLTTRQDLIEAAAKGSRISQMDCAIALQHFLEMIPRALMLIKANCGNGAVELRGFGTFHTKIRKSRPAQNPRTLEKVMLPRRRVMLFRPSPILIQALKKSKGVKPSFSQSDRVREPILFELDVKGIRAIVHRHHYAPGKWLLSCDDLGLERFEMKSEKIEIAKTQALEKLASVLAKKMLLYQAIFAKIAKLTKGTEL